MWKRTTPIPHKTILWGLPLTRVPCSSSTLDDEDQPCWHPIEVIPCACQGQQGHHHICIVHLLPSTITIQKTKGILNLYVKLAKKVKVKKQQLQVVIRSYAVAKLDLVTTYPTRSYGASKVELVITYLVYPLASLSFRPPPYLPQDKQFPPRPYPPKASYSKMHVVVF